MTPPAQQSEAHFKFLGSEIDLKGKAAKSAPLIVAILAFALACYAIYGFNHLDAKVDKILFILAEQ